MKVEDKQEYTPEQIQQFKAAMKAQLTEEIPFLELKKQHQTLVTELDELYMRSAMAQQRIANIMAPAPKEAEEKVDIFKDLDESGLVTEVGKRRLKVEKKETVE